MVSLEVGGEGWRVGDGECVRGVGEGGKERVSGGVCVGECVCGRGGGDGEAGLGLEGARLRGSKGGTPGNDLAGSFVPPDGGPVGGSGGNPSCVAARASEDTSRGSQDCIDTFKFPCVLRMCLILSFCLFLFRSFTPFCSSSFLPIPSLSRGCVAPFRSVWWAWENRSSPSGTEHHGFVVLSCAEVTAASLPSDAMASPRREIISNTFKLWSPAFA